MRVSLGPFGRILGALSALVASASCLIPSIAAQQDLPGGFKATPISAQAAVQRGTTIHLALQVSLGLGFHVQSNKPRDPTLVGAALSFDAPPGVRVTEVVFPAAIDFPLPGFPEPLAVFEREFIVGVTVEVGTTVESDPVVLPGRFRYQACNDTSCMKPTSADVRWTLPLAPRGTPISRQHANVFAGIPFGTGEPPPAWVARPTPAIAPAEPKDVVALFDRFTILGRDDGYLDVPAFLSFIRDAENGVKRRGMFEGKGPLAILAIVFLGGLALNLTPCVLPMIPINLAIIGAGATQSRRSRGFFLGATYGAAMAVVYGVLGVVVILTAGTFGTLNASPWFNGGIAVVFVLLALAMFDVISIDFSRFSSRLRFDSQSRGSALLAFTMGAVAALLAGACVAPVVIQVVVFASDLYAAGNTTALALPFILGLGMALPWPIAGAGFAVLPRSGAWMIRVKQVMGVFILGTAVYYGYIAYGIVANRMVDPAAVRASVEEKLREGWHSSLAEGLAASEQSGTLALIDFWATWCKNCVVMDATTLKDPQVTSALSNYVRIKFQAEDPDSAPARELLKRIGAVGLPAYVILRPPSSTIGSPVR